MGKKTVKLNIDKLLFERKLTQKNLSELADIRQARISELVNGKFDRVSLTHLTKIANALNIEDINELVTIQEVDDEKTKK